MNDIPASPKPHPCSTCPYRRDVPSGVWDSTEYDKLPGYDGEIGDQVEAGAVRPFFCHNADGHVCAGWAGHREPYKLLAVRLGVSNETLNPAILDYSTPVPLFASGTEAADHGKQKIECPGSETIAAIAKIVRKQEQKESR